jgi:chloride channel protein, CIC family
MRSAFTMASRIFRLPGTPAERFRDWIRGSPGGLVTLSLVIGGGAGAGAVLFRYLILWFTILFSGHEDYSAVGPAPHPMVPWLGTAFVILAPVIGGLIYGPLIDWFAREARGHGVPEVMLAVAERGGRIRPQVAVVKSLASALCIGSGGSVGREGPIVQIGSALGSSLGQIVRVSDRRLRLLVACGAAGGISATFNAPIAGVLFALELILRDFEVESFGVVVVASVASNIIGRAAFGSAAFLSLPEFSLRSPWEYFLYAGLGLVAAVVGMLFVRVLYGFEDVVDLVWRGPEWLRPGVGAVALGALLFLVPQMYGVGYPVLEHAIRGDYAFWFVLVLLVAKMLATSLTIAIGGSGGVFAPSLFLGAMLGTAYGAAFQHVFPAVAGAPGAYGLVGMGALFAAAARAPITAVIIIFELTGEYRIILPLMFAISFAAGVSTLLSRDTIYTLKLRRRGIDVMRGRAANLMATITVKDAMQPLPEALREDLPLNEVVARLTAEQREALPVVDRSGRYRGTVTMRLVEEEMRENALDAVVGSLVQPAPTLTVDQNLERALTVLVRSESGGLPVLDGDRRSVIGWLTHRDVLRAYNARLERGISRAAREGTPLGRTESPDGPPLARLRGYRIVDLEVKRSVPHRKRRVADIHWPPGSLVLAIRRDGETFEPTEATEVKKGDRLTVLVPAETASALTDVLD